MTALPMLTCLPYLLTPLCLLALTPQMQVGIEKITYWFVWANQKTWRTAVHVALAFLLSFVPPGKAKSSRFRHGKEPRLVKFGQDSDLPDAVCHKLLAKHMPDIVHTNKMYQKLFIGWVKWMQYTHWSWTPVLWYLFCSGAVTHCVIIYCVRVCCFLCLHACPDTWSDDASFLRGFLDWTTIKASCYIHLSRISILF